MKTKTDLDLTWYDLIILLALYQSKEKIDKQRLSKLVYLVRKELKDIEPYEDLRFQINMKTKEVKLDPNIYAILATIELDTDAIDTDPNDDKYYLTEKGYNLVESILKDPKYAFKARKITKILDKYLKLSDDELFNEILKNLDTITEVKAFENSPEMSEIFEVDVGELSWLLETTETFITNTMTKIKLKEIKNEDLPEVFRDLNNRISKINFLHTLLYAKVYRYRDSNEALKGFINSIDSDLRRAWTIAIDAEKTFREDSNYNIESAYKALEDLLFLIKNVREELEEAIKRGLFA